MNERSFILVFIHFRMIFLTQEPSPATTNTIVLDGYKTCVGGLLLCIDETDLVLLNYIISFILARR